MPVLSLEISVYLENDSHIRTLQFYLHNYMTTTVIAYILFIYLYPIYYERRFAIYTSRLNTWSIWNASVDFQFYSAVDLGICSFKLQTLVDCFQQWMENVPYMGIFNHKQSWLLTNDVQESHIFIAVITIYRAILVLICGLYLNAINCQPLQWVSKQRR